MSLKNEFMEKLPDSLKQDQHCLALFDHIKEHNIDTSEHLFNFLDQKISLVEKWLEENQNSGTTMAKTVRDKVVELGFLKKCRQLSKEFL